MSTTVQQNDIVTLADRTGTWKVLTQVNGSMADMRRDDDSDIRVVTAPLESVTVLHRAGSPAYDY
jgi:hypothetical protein